MNDVANRPSTQHGAPLRFHWRLPLWGDNTSSWRQAKAHSGLPDLANQAHFCHTAEACGIDSVLTACAWSMPDPLTLAAALAGITTRIKFIIAWRSAFSAPTHFVQQINTLSQLCPGRVAINMVAGHSPAEQGFYGDRAPHDARYQRSQEYLAICRQLWSSRQPQDFEGQWFQVNAARLATPYAGSSAETAPRIYVGGGSPAALALATDHGDCWLCFAEPPQVLAKTVAQLRGLGLACGLRASIIARETRHEALDNAAALIQGADGPRRTLGTGSSDSQQFGQAAQQSAASDWSTPWLWHGAVGTYGVSAVSLVGSYDKVARAILEYAAIGVSEFIFSGWPNQTELTHFGNGVLGRLQAWRAA